MLKYLLEKEFAQLLRNKFLPRMIILYPLMVLLVFPLAANFELKSINLAIVDVDRSPYSSRLAEKIGASGYFHFTNDSREYSEALKSIELDKADLILEIPSGFEKQLVKEGKASVMITANAVNGSKAGLGSAYLSRTVTDFSSEIRGELIQGNSRLAVPFFEIITQYRYNPHLDYPVYMVPAIMAMVLIMICGFLPALNIVGEKENGTIEQLNVTPVRKFTLIISKLIPYWIVGLIVLTICFGVAATMYRLVPPGGYLTIYIFAIVFILSISGFGLVLSNYANSLQQAMFMMFFFIITMIFMSGLYTPISSMPAWGRALSAASPLRYFIEVLRLVFLKGSSVFELRSQMFALALFAVFFNAWAILGYRKTNG